MMTLYKLTLFFIIFGFMAIAGLRLFRYLNKKIMDSTTGWGLLAYSILLIAANIALFFGGLWVLIKTYAFLAASE